MFDNKITYDQVESIEDFREDDVYDLMILEMDCYLGEGNYVANGIVTHNSGFHTSWVNRKLGKETYERHPVLDEILEPTFYCLIYQETISKILEKVGRFPPNECEEVRKAISKKKPGVFEKYREKFVSNAMEILNWDRIKVEEFFDQIDKFSGYAFNLSHSVCYTIVSMRLLWLKSHYPLEFFQAVLSCETKEENIKDFRNDAFENFGIKIKPVDINKSKVNFEICDEEKEPTIYFGFSNIKGIGEDQARKIVQHQPYNDLNDFLIKFGTVATVLKPLIGLRVFGQDARDVYVKYKTFCESIPCLEKIKEWEIKVKKEIKEYLPDDFGDFDLNDDFIDRVIGRLDGEEK